MEEVIEKIVAQETSPENTIATNQIKLAATSPLSSINMEDNFNDALFDYNVDDYDYDYDYFKLNEKTCRTTITTL